MPSSSQPTASMTTKGPMIPAASSEIVLDPSDISSTSVAKLDWEGIASNQLCNSGGDASGYADIRAGGVCWGL